MSREENARHTASSLSETDVSERMASFRAALAWMNANPDEAARILAISEKTDREISDILATDSLHEYDPELSLRAHVTAVLARENSPLDRPEEVIHEAELHVQKRLLETERTAYRAELDQRWPPRRGRWQAWRRQVVRRHREPRACRSCPARRSPPWRPPGPAHRGTRRSQSRTGDATSGIWCGPSRQGRKLPRHAGCD